MKKKNGTRQPRTFPVQVNLTKSEKDEFVKKRVAKGARTDAEYLYRIVQKDLAGV